MLVEVLALLYSPLPFVFETLFLPELGPEEGEGMAAAWADGSRWAAPTRWTSAEGTAAVVQGTVRDETSIADSPSMKFVSDIRSASL